MTTATYLTGTQSKVSVKYKTSAHDQGSISSTHPLFMQTMTPISKDLFKVGMLRIKKDKTKTGFCSKATRNCSQ